MDYETMVDAKRVENAKAAQAALVLAERDAAAELAAAQAAAKQAHAAAQDAADRGEGAKVLDAAEVAVDAAERRARTAGRLLKAAQKRVQDGEAQRDAEVRNGHAKAVSAAMQRRFDMLDDAHEMFAKLAEMRAEFQECAAALRKLHQGAGIGEPNGLQLHAPLIMEHNHQPLDRKDFTAHLVGIGWNVETRKFRWMEA